MHLPRRPFYKWCAKAGTGIFTGAYEKRHHNPPPGAAGLRRRLDKIMRCIAQSFSPGEVHVSIMRQFVPCYQCALHPELNRRVTTYEYRRVTDEAARLGLLGYTQEKNSADGGYTPSFDLSGL